MDKEKKLKAKITNGPWVFYIIAGVFAVICFLPLWITLVSSLSSESAVTLNGYSLWPQETTLETYKYIIDNKGSMLLRAFGVTFLVVVLGTVFSLVVTTCFAYVTAQRKDTFKFANALSFFAWFTTIFSGGLLPWYILTTRYYGLQNNIFALFVPSAMSVFLMFVLKNNFRSLPVELVESAKIDGAGNMRIFVQIAIPLTKVAMVTITLFYALQYWNDFHLSLYLITKNELYTMQKLLYNMMANISALMSNSNMASAASSIQIPTNTARMAMTVMTIAPVLVFYPYAQKYFVKGITIGAVKG